MPVQVRCPQCGRTFNLDSVSPGRRGRCGGCGHIFELASSMLGIGPRVPTSLAGDVAFAPTLAPTPERVGRFEVRGRLGYGAFGAVYRAFDPVLEREVALKVPHAGTLADPQSAERFLREARAAARLRHANIVPVYEAGSADGTYYIATAFIEGKTLSDLLTAGAVEPRRAARLIAALAEGLHHAHQQGIVHRDVKPGNVLLDAADRPHLTDFGMARLQGSEDRLTQAGQILGTVLYMSPEQASGRGVEATAASDQYALGVMLFELLTGETPFSGPMQVVLFHTLHSPVPLPRTLKPDLPEALQAICLKALAKSPADRFPDCHALAEALSLWLDAPPEPAPTQAPGQGTVPGAQAATAGEVPGPAQAVSNAKALSALVRFDSTVPVASAARPRRIRLPGRRAGVALLAAGAIGMLAIGGLLAYHWSGSKPPDAPLSRTEAATVAPASVPARPASDPAPLLAGGTAGSVGFLARAIDPNRSIPARELVDTGWQVPYKATAPALDGKIVPDEYGPALALDFTDDTNPGRLGVGSIQDLKDLSAWVFTAYTTTDLHVAVRVRDDAVFVDAANADRPWENDGVEVFLDGDLAANDMTNADPTGNPEGFQLVCDAGGNRFSQGAQLTDWASAARTPDGYVIEFRIPLARIDTQDGPAERPAQPGATFRFNVMINDHEPGNSPARQYGALWLEGSDTTPRFTPEGRWRAKLHLGALALQADHRSRSPVLDGKIGPDEYGPGLDLDFTGDANPARLYYGSIAGPEDMRGRLHTAHSDADLFVAMRVWDDQIAEGDGVELGIDGDRLANDFPPKRDDSPRGNREGFYVGVYQPTGRLFEHVPLRKGSGRSLAARMGPAEGGYVVEYQIPLALIDTRDGPEARPAAPGSTLRFELKLADNEPDSNNAGGALWYLDGLNSPFGGGEPRWWSELHLARPVRYTLTSGPPGATLDPDTGFFYWPPPEGPFVQKLTIRAADRERPSLWSEAVVTVTGNGPSGFAWTAQPSNASSPDGMRLPPMLAIQPLDERTEEMASTPGGFAGVAAPNPNQPQPDFVVRNPANGHTYTLTSARMNWEQAEAEAVARGGHLVAVNDKAEQDFLVQHFVSASVPGGEHQPFWMGLRDTSRSPTVQGRKFEWTTGEPVTFTSWEPATGEPNNSTADEWYGAFNFHYGVRRQPVKGTWNDTSLNGSVNGPYYGIIELPPSPQGTARAATAPPAAIIPAASIPNPRPGSVLDRRAAYYEQVQKAHRAWEAGDYTGAATHLEATSSDLRGWEWRYVKRLCEREVRPGGVDAPPPGSSGVAPDAGDVEVLVVTGDSASFVASGARFAGRSRGGVSLWSAATGRELGHVDFKVDTTREAFTGLAAGPDGQWVMTAWSPAGIRIYNMRTRRQAREFHSKVPPFVGIAISPDGKTIATGGDDGGLRLWDGQTGALRWERTDHRERIWNVAFSPDGARVASVSHDLARVWHTGRGDVVSSAAGGRALAFSPDGRHLGVANYNHGVQVWDLDRSKEVFKLATVG